MDVFSVHRGKDVCRVCSKTGLPEPVFIFFILKGLLYRNYLVFLQIA